MVWTEWIKYTRNRWYLAYFVEAPGFFLAMCYIFIGIAIASDTFMGAIETICGSTRKVKTTTKEGGITITTTKEEPIWNETVANLTLMALGSSAPEILLSTIEICSGLSKHNPGDLGPGTIVGSAAFNLMIISAVCVVSVPSSETKRIKLYRVFSVTCVSSLFAYIWMAVVLAWLTPDVVTVWEAVLTLAFFPILIVIAYLTDRKFFVDNCSNKNERPLDESLNSGPDRDFRFGEDGHNHFRLFDADGNYDEKGILQMYNCLCEVADLTEKEVVHILASKLIHTKRHPKTWYKHKAAKLILAGGNMEPVLDEKLKEVVAILDEYNPGTLHARKSILIPAAVRSEILQNKAVVEFHAAAIAVAEAIGEFQVNITRIGKQDVGFSVLVETVDGSAKHDEQYHAISETIKFEPYVLEMFVTVKVIDNVNWNPDSNFYLKLTVPEESQERASVGRMRVTEVIIQDDEKPGKISFDKRGCIFKETETKAAIDVIRKYGSDGVVSVTWTAIPGPNCKRIAPGTSGTVEFMANELQKYIEVPFLPLSKPTESKDEYFDVILSDPKGGAKLGKIPKTTCAVTDDANFRLEVTHVVTAAVDLCEESERPASYGDQILEAVIPNGGDWRDAKWYHWIIHIICFPLKFLCSLIPPPHCAGGWPCFVISLVVVGFFTKLVGEFAGNFGEAMGIPPTITAITVVALGTSLPDTFASRFAAMNDPVADNAIGNVTGSNSVNVFLGLGVPWVIGALFYEFVQTDDLAGAKSYNPFCVPAGSLTFNVLTFSACAVLTILVLIVRRYTSCCGKAELGGNAWMKWISAIIMVLLWCAYIALSSWEAIENFFVKITGTKETYCQALVDTAKNW